MKMKFSGWMCDRPSAESAWKWFSSPSHSQKSVRADGGNIFRYLLILEYLPRILVLPLSLPQPSSFSRLFFFLLHALSLSRMCDNIENDSAHVLLNRKVIVRILNIKCASKMKRRIFGFIFQLVNLILNKYALE